MTTESRARHIAAHGAASADHITLPYQDRYRRRCRLVTDGGLSVILDLPALTELRDGAALVLEDGRQIGIRAADEPLSEVRASGAALARLAWHVGNRHTPCQIEADRILIQHDHVLEDMLRGLGAIITRIEAPFQPEGGAYGHGRTHGHSHSHDPHEDPNAHLHDHAHNHHHE